MRTLMISLDNKILDPNSAVAERMRILGEMNNLDIIIPFATASEVPLSETVRVHGTGGKKIIRFFRLIKIGRRLHQQFFYDTITAQDPFLTALAALLMRKKEQLEIQVHGDFFSSGFFRTSSFKNWLYYWLARIITLPRADIVRVVGERVKQSLIKLGCSVEKIIVRPVALSLSADSIRARQPLKDIKKEFPGFRKYFAYVGRLEKEKNVAWLLEVFDEYLQESNQSDVLVIVGEGSQKKFLRDSAAVLHREKVILFKEWTANPIDYIKTADCVLVPSLIEGYGLVAMETAAAGTKLIMTDVGVAGYELPSSDQVKIVPVNNRTALVEALKEI